MSARDNFRPVAVVVSLPDFEDATPKSTPELKALIAEQGDVELALASLIDDVYFAQRANADLNYYPGVSFVV